MRDDILIIKRDLYSKFHIILGLLILFIAVIIDDDDSTSFKIKIKTHLLP